MFKNDTSFSYYMYMCVRISTTYACTYSMYVKRTCTVHPIIMHMNNAYTYVHVYKYTHEDIQNVQCGLRPAHWKGTTIIYEHTTLVTRYTSCQLYVYTRTFSWYMTETNNIGMFVYTLNICLSQHKAYILCKKKN